jgi:hypothetical protein
MVLIFA